MPEQHLDDANVHAVLEQVRGETVPQRMRADVLGQACRLGCGLDDAAELAGGDGLVPGPGRGTANRRAA